MALWIEVMGKHGGRVLLEAGAIMGFNMAPGATAFTTPTADEPLHIVLRGGNVIEVMGESAACTIARLEAARIDYRENSRSFFVDWIDPNNADPDAPSPMAPDVPPLPQERHGPVQGNDGAGADHALRSPEPIP